jgi:hypothetical protein
MAAGRPTDYEKDVIPTVREFIKNRLPHRDRDPAGERRRIRALKRGHRGTRRGRLHRGPLPRRRHVRTHSFEHDWEAPIHAPGTPSQAAGAGHAEGASALGEPLQQEEIGAVDVPVS